MAEADRKRAARTFCVAGSECDDAGDTSLAATVATPKSLRRLLNKSVFPSLQRRGIRSCSRFVPHPRSSVILQVTEVGSGRLANSTSVRSRIGFLADKCMRVGVNNLRRQRFSDKKCGFMALAVAGDPQWVPF